MATGSPERRIIRKAARVLLLDPAARVLLVQFGPTPTGRYFWLTPGGGVERGETFEEAAHRELAEELELTGVDLGPVVWAREFPFQGRRGPVIQMERWFVVRIEGHEVDPVHVERLAPEGIVAVRWWADDELRTTRESLAPRGLAKLVADVRAGHPLSGAYDTY